METIPQLKFTRNYSPPTLFGILLALVILLSASYTAAYWYFKGIETSRAQVRMSLYQNTLSAELERFSHVPFILARDTFVIAGAEGRSREPLNIRLSEFAEQASLDAIYLMDMQGDTIAASNWNEELTFLGQNYGFRPYFQQATDGERGEFFAIGATTSQPGYFIAEPVHAASGDIIGVVAIKLDLNNLANAWASGGESVFVSNSDGIVVLASDPGWRYQAIEPLTSTQREAIIAARQFGAQPLSNLNWSASGADIATLDGSTYLHVETPLVRPDWRLHYLADLNLVTGRATVFTAALVTAILLILAISIYQRSQRMRVALQASQADRRTLRRVNTDLGREIEDRRKAEKRLTKAQEDLARAGRLAALGQLSASVTHELGQPIAAMRNYLTAAEFDQTGDQSDVLKRLGRIATRMESITRQLKFFAGRGEHGLVEVDLRQLVDGAEVLLGPDFENQKVTVYTVVPNTPVLVSGNRLRLEQVVVNLLRNSLDALTETDDRKIWITISKTDSVARVCVEDNGQGLMGQTTEELLEPFHTTRASGQGMGLGLAISAAIVKEHEGTLSASNRDEGGACFIIEIPLREDEAEE